MCRLSFLLLLAAGCSSSPPKMVEGTSIALGAYLPWDGVLYGVELISYVNGTVVKAPTNTAYHIERRHSATNDWAWGLLRSAETTNTQVQFR